MYLLMGMAFSHILIIDFITLVRVISSHRANQTDDKIIIESCEWNTSIAVARLGYFIERGALAVIEASLIARYFAPLQPLCSLVYETISLLHFQ